MRRSSGLRRSDPPNKIVEIAELLARIEPLLSRAIKESRASTAPGGESYRFGDVILDFRRATATKAAEKLDLSVREFMLLRYFVRNRGTPLTRDELLNEVWGCDSTSSAGTVDVHVGWLRQKVEDDPQRPRYIVTIRGLGYKFVG